MRVMNLLLVLLCTASLTVERSDRRPTSGTTETFSRGCRETRRDTKERCTKERGASTSDASLEIISHRMCGLWFASTSPVFPERHSRYKVNKSPSRINSHDYRARHGFGRFSAQRKSCTRDGSDVELNIKPTRNCKIKH